MGWDGWSSFSFFSSFCFGLFCLFLASFWPFFYTLFCCCLFLPFLSLSFLFCCFWFLPHFTYTLVLFVLCTALLLMLDARCVCVCTACCAFPAEGCGLAPPSIIEESNVFVSYGVYDDITYHHSYKVAGNHGGSSY